MWIVVNKFDVRAAALADRHYSRRKRGSPQFMPPGETLVLLSRDAQAVWGWWRPHPRSGLKALNGLDGWTCTIFRNESCGRLISSDLVLAAEAALRASGRGCGPDGLITYVWPSRIRSTNPGCCFKKAGWRHTGWSADGRKMLFQKPWRADKMVDWEIVHGDCLGIMAELPDGCADVVITDPPYDDHTHRAQRTGITGYVEPTRPGATRAQYYRNRDLAFEPMTPELMTGCAGAWARLARRWVLVFCALEMISDWRSALEHAGLQYVRAQIWHRRGGAPQFTGDRPAQACEAIVTAHRPGRKRWNAGGKHGFYEDAVVLNRGKKKERLHTAQKPLGLMQELVRRFTEPGELVLDPFAGSGSTGHACLLEGRAFLGIEKDEKYVAVARHRLEGVHGQVLTRDVHEPAV